MYVGMFGQKGIDLLGLMGGEVVGDHMYLLTARRLATTSVKKATNSAAVCRAAQRRY